MSALLRGACPAALLLLAVVTGPIRLLAADPAWYTKAATWPESLRLSRDALRRQEAADAARPAPEAEPALRLEPWFRVGPFVPPPGQRGFGFAFPPETGVDLKAPCGDQRWQAASDYVDGVVHMMSAPTNGSTYLFRQIRSPDARQVTAYFGSDDGLVVWLNGAQVLARDVPRGPGPNQDSLALNLKPGENALLLKIYNISGGHGFYFSTNAAPGPARDPAQVRRDELWTLIARDFADGAARQEMAWEREDAIWASDWSPGEAAELAARYLAAIRIPSLAREAEPVAGAARDPTSLPRLRELYLLARRTEAAAAFVRSFDFAALRLAVEDLQRGFPGRYPKGAEWLAQLARLETAAKGLAEAMDKGDPEGVRRLAGLGDELRDLREQALLANPLLAFERLLVVKRGAGTPSLGLPQNWQGNCALPRSGYNDEIAVLSPVRPGGALTTLYRPAAGRFVGDVDLHPDADRLLFSMVGARDRWQVWELRADGTGLRQVTADEPADVDNYDACYLPNDRIVFASTRCFQGVPCVGGGNTVANLCLTEPDGSGVRQLCFDQDHNWCPTVLNDGRVLYSRWEYSDTAHYFTRLLFQMNPDGTGQMAFYGSNSYWPNSIFYARPVPGSPTQVIAVISGHHGVPRMGELILFDVSRGRHEADGVVQRIPGRGRKVEPLIRDTLVDESWPRFLHPYPLSDKYFLVSCQPRPGALWGVYLADVFDNLLLLAEGPGYALFEPLPFRPTVRGPVIPDRVRPESREATVYLADVYAGPGLQGVPRGTVKALRVYECHYAYPRMGGHIHIGIDGPWDVHRIHGTVPVAADGSALFRVPANTPLAVQPLDAEGKALQVMRSWFTAMPGEVLSCVGCHDTANATTPARLTAAAGRRPTEIRPWYGPPRGFSFRREVQPVLDRFCIPCHDGKPRPDGRVLANLADTGKGWRGFTNSYIALHPYVRRPGPESDYHLQPPGEWHADTSELVQMLRKGHHGVRLDAEAWDRLVTWIDLNVPDHGSWHEHNQVPDQFDRRRQEMRSTYANRPEALEAETEVANAPARPAPVIPAPEAAAAAEAPVCPGWPFAAAEAGRRAQASGLNPALALDLGDGRSLEFVVVPGGEFVMGDPAGAADEQPATRVRIETPFYLARFEVSNEQYRRFDPEHDSGYVSVFNKDQSTRGEPVNGDRQPAVRVSWRQAVAFCEWASRRTGRRVRLPTEAQWEYACRAGAASALAYGNADADFGAQANLADERLNALTRGDSPKWIPAVMTVNDGATVTAAVGKYAGNAWGLCDMHGNAAEWTASVYRPYPCADGDGRDAPDADGPRVVRGGSFYDRPARARASFRLAFPTWQRLAMVGFRVVCEPTDEDKVPPRVASVP